MPRSAMMLLACAIAACGGTDSTGPSGVAAVTVTAANPTIGVGETTTLTAKTLDANGAVLTGRPVTYASNADAVATVTADGTVTGVAVGSAVITATSEGKNGTTVIVVTTSAAACDGVAPISLAVGEVRLLAGAERTTLCPSGEVAGAEYALIPVNTSADRLSESLTLSAAKTSNALGPPSALRSSVTGDQLAGLVSPSLIASPSQVEGAMPRNYAFEDALRASTRSLRATAAARARAMGSVRIPAAHINGLPTSPSVGTLVSLNVNSDGNTACSVPTLRTGRVAAVSNSAIVIEDTLRPAGGMTNADYLSVATTFDTLVYALDTTYFGAPYDMDGNGRIVMLFTSAVNQLTSPGATSVVNGFFFLRDLFPRTATAQVPVSCATSNEGEMFYLPVVDPASQYNSFFQSKGKVLSEVIATTIHEFQHLINASRRIYVTPAIVEDEEPWLNEGMSHLAQEILYLHVAGLSPAGNITFAQSLQGPARDSALKAYEVDNLANFSTYLKSPETNTSYLLNDDLTTRGAACALLRYALDQSPSPPATYLRGLVDAPTQGIPNFNLNFPQLGGLAGAVRGAAVANFTDDAVAVNATYTYPTWNYRDWLPHFVSNNSAYPEATHQLPAGANLPLTLVAGGSSVVRFRVAGGATGVVALGYTGAGGAAAIEMMLVRTQ